MSFGEKYNKAVTLIKEAYKSNKELIIANNTSYPKEYLYALRMIEVLEHFAPESSEEVYLAAWCQHLNRWDIPRNTYPMDRKGYHQWRSYLYTYQADKAGDILTVAEYDAEAIATIKELIAKKNLKSNEQSQLLEDVVCLVFLTYNLSEFVETHKDDIEKLIRIIKSTWLKMSEKGHSAALDISFTKEIKALILTAVSK